MKEALDIIIPWHLSPGPLPGLKNGQSEKKQHPPAHHEGWGQSEPAPTSSTMKDDGKWLGKQLSVEFPVLYLTMLISSSCLFLFFVLLTYLGL